MKKLSNLYLKYKYVWNRSTRQWNYIEDKGGYLFSKGIYPTKILPKDLPPWYVYGYLYKCHGYISAAGIKDLLCRPCKFTNHMFKDDFLFISYDRPIKSRDGTIADVTEYDELIYGGLIIPYLKAAEKYSDYNVSGIKEAIEDKRKWFKEAYPDDYALEVGGNEPFFK